MSFIKEVYEELEGLYPKKKSISNWLFVERRSLITSAWIQNTKVSNHLNIFIDIAYELKIIGVKIRMKTKF